MNPLNSSPSFALLPLYLEVYDKARPALLPRQEGFLKRVVALLGDHGIDVTVLPVCRTRPQATSAITRAEQEGVAGIITLHLAYSPSLEAGPPLVETALPILMLDTTPALSFDISATNDDVLDNHGIHGVQDLASLLRRQGRSYTLAVGALNDPRLLSRAEAWARAARARHALRRMRVGRIGESFEGMGDFRVSDDFLRRSVGPTVVPIDVAHLGELNVRVTIEEIAAEREADRAAFDCSGCAQQSWDRSNRDGIALRKALAEVEAQAFAFNFLCFDRKHGVSTVPFLEASKAMARGMGYAGEGDVLTASLVAALNLCYSATTFTEMFCPDWRGGRVFMGHMGECNPALAKSKPRLVEMDYPYGPVEAPVVVVFPLRPGPAALVNLAPGPQETLSLITADVTIDDTELGPAMPAFPHFWVRPPAGDVAVFLEGFSRAGGTHHSALTPGLHAADLRPLAEMMGWQFVLNE
jgi:L-arabinose isomerase